MKISLRAGSESISPTKKANGLSRQFPVFLVVGSLCVLVDYLTYIMLLEFATPVLVAKGLSYCVGMLVGFVGNRAFTFQARGSAFNYLLAYMALYVATLAVNIGSNACVNYAFHSQSLAFLVATGITTVANFLGMKFFAFRERPTDAILFEHSVVPRVNSNRHAA